MRLFLLALLPLSAALAQQPGDALPPWTPGTLDIHQIQTGRGNAAFFIFPDGRTLLLDAGAVPDKPGPELGPARPNASRTPSQWIADYILQFAPRRPAALDYAVVTHYHDDHIAGLPDVAAAIPIKTLIERGEDPPPPNAPATAAFRRFRAAFQGTLQIARAGRADQIVSAWPNFEVRNIAANGEVWTGVNMFARDLFPPNWPKLPRDEQPTENERSIALRIRYGPFSYFTGGDLPGVVLDNLPSWHDLETPIARVVGPVDVLVLNHHGWLDSTNAEFLATLQPRVVVIPAWHATHPDHGVLRRLRATRIYPGPRDLFITTLLDPPRAIFSYLGKSFAGTEGHVLVRVAPGGAGYRVFILDDATESRRITTIHGPYQKP